MAILLELFLSFVRINLFTIGGGLVAIPLIQQTVSEKGWMTHEMFANMVAIAQSTPGAIGINTATFVGFQQYAILGAAVATIGIVLPSVIIVLVIARFLHHFNDDPRVKAFFKYLRPTVVGLIITAVYYIGRISLTGTDADGGITFNLIGTGLFIAVVLLNRRWKPSPIIYIAIGGLFGVLFF